MPGIRTLVVEDDFVSRKILNAMLAPLGTCDIATNGEEALSAFSNALQAREPYQLICLDINMPGLNGHEVLAKIRSLEGDNGFQGIDRTRVIMTTASSDRENIYSAFEGECDAYLVKPIQKEKLMKHLDILRLL